MLLLKLTLTPLIIWAVTMIGRRWGPRVAGLVAGLPLTSGPVSAFLAVERGPGFAARAAVGGVAGLAGAAVFCATYAVVARRRGWPAALAGAWTGLVATTVLLNGLGATALPFPVLVTLALAAIVLLWGAVSRLTAGVPAAGAARGGARRERAPWWDLPARAAVSTLMVAAVTAAAPLLGARASGVLSALPVINAVAAAFTHRREGWAAAVALTRGSVIACAAGVLFLAAVGTLAVPGRLATAYAAAALCAAAWGAGVSHLTRPRTPRGAYGA